MSDQVELQLVYGKISDYELVFIPQHQAVELARLHHALLLAATWGELKQSTTEARWREAVSAARDEDDQDPGDDDPFDTDELAPTAMATVPNGRPKVLTGWPPTSRRASMSEALQS